MILINESNKFSRIMCRYIIPYILILIFILWNIFTWILPYWFVTFPIVGTFVSLFLYIRKKYSTGIKKSTYRAILDIFIPSLTLLYLLGIFNWYSAWALFIVIFITYFISKLLWPAFFPSSNELTSYKKATEINPENAEAWFGLGKAYAAIEKNEKAINATEIGLYLKGNPDAWKLLDKLKALSKTSVPIRKRKLFKQCSYCNNEIPRNGENCPYCWARENGNVPKELKKKKPLENKQPHLEQVSSIDNTTHRQSKDKKDSDNKFGIKIKTIDSILEDAEVNFEANIFGEFIRLRFLAIEKISELIYSKLFPNNVEKFDIIHDCIRKIEEKLKKRIANHKKLAQWRKVRNDYTHNNTTINKLQADRGREFFNILIDNLRAIYKTILQNYIENV